MLLNNENVDYLSDWPTHYYEIEDINERERILQLAIEQKLDPIYDEKRLSVLKKRFGEHPSEKRADRFLHAWMMIQATGAGGVSFFQKKRKKKALCGYLAQLGIRMDEMQSEEKNSDDEETFGCVLEEEWKNFAYTYLASCTGSRAYCSTLFGIVPIKDAAVAEKIAQDIDLVTRDYPAAFGLEESVSPFRNIMVDAFCQYIPNGASVWKVMHGSENG